MQLYNFARLIRKYASDFKTIVLTGGYYDDAGDFQKAEDKKQTLDGAIISFKESKIYRSEGTLTTNDKRLFTLAPIADYLQGSKIEFEGKVYSVEDVSSNFKFTGVYAYTMRYVSAYKDDSHPYDATKELNMLEQRLDGVLEERTRPSKPPYDTEAKALEKRLDGTLEDNFIVD